MIQMYEYKDTQYQDVYHKVTKQIITVERKCSEPIELVQKWLRNNGLELAIQVTEAVLLTTRNILESRDLGGCS